MVESAAAVAPTTTVAGAGTALGALYRPDVLIVPTVLLPPVMPFSFQLTPVFVMFCTVAVNCFVLLTRTVALVGVMLMVTGGGDTTFT